VVRGRFDHRLRGSLRREGPVLWSGRGYSPCDTYVDQERVIGAAHLAEAALLPTQRALASPSTPPSLLRAPCPSHRCPPSHRLIGVRLGVFSPATLELTPFGRALERQVLEVLGAWSGDTRPASLTRAEAWAQRVVALCGLEPGRIEVSGLSLAGAVSVEGPPGAAWIGLDRWGRPWAACRLVPDTDDRASASVERDWHSSLNSRELLACLLEQGAWPMWLAPEAVRILPVGPLAASAGQTLSRDLEGRGIPASVDAEGPLAGRVRRSEVDHVPVAVVLGPREVAAGTATIRWRSATSRLGSALYTLPLAEALAWMCAAHQSTSGGTIGPPSPPTPTGGYRHSAS
jgi:hypothetical protein